MDRVIVFDTTLRDGEQSPGFSMNTMEKLEMARQLARLNVDVIEAGFPISSDEDFEATREVAKQVGTLEGAPMVCGLSRVGLADIDRCWEAVRYARRARIHTFVATSDIHLKYKLRKSRSEVMKAAVEAVRHARSYCEDVEFSPEDASRSDFDYMCDVLSAVIDAGARTINIPDTVGYAIPQEWAERISRIREKVHGIERAVLSVHCHNDLGQAVANSLTAIQNGARQVECTINGIGERAGNASLEEVVMAFRTRQDVLKVQTGVQTEKLYPTSRLVAQVTGLHVQRNKALVGQNAFAHEAGIHQHGMLTHRETYEIMRPEEVGFAKSQLVLGKHSGRHALKDRLVALGYKLDEAQVDKVFQDFKVLADKKKEIFDEDLEAIVEGMIQASADLWELVALQTTAGTGVIPTATIELRDIEGKVHRDAATGDGPIDAAYSAIQRLTGMDDAKLVEYQIRAVTGGRDAQGEVTVVIEHGGKKVRGRAFSTDIIEASARAYLNGVNRILFRCELENHKPTQL